MKTRLFTRKRALISSVAMLLVAMMALGTATFAWFTTSPNASAEGLSVQASASVGLKMLSESQASKTGKDYTVGDNYVAKTYLNSNDAGTATLGDNFVLSPTSIDASSAAVKAYKTEALSDDAADRDPAKAVAEATKGGFNAGGDYYAEKIYVTLVGTTEATTKELSLAAALDFSGISKAMKSGMRVIITYHDSTNNTDTVVAKLANTAGSYSVYTSTAAASAEPTTASLTYTESLAKTAVGTVSSNAGADYFTVYVGLDGNDANVKSRTVDASTLLKKITLNASIPA